MPEPHARPHQPRWLLMVAAPTEEQAVQRGLEAAGPPRRLAVVRTGIGKVNAALAAAAATGSLPGIEAVINLGVAGSLPRPDRGGQPDEHLPAGTIVVAQESIYADEGVATPDGFLDCAQIGFPLSGDLPPQSAFAGSRIRTDEVLRQTIAAALPDAVVASVATVSTCSGTDALARAVAARTGGACEAMEGAAIGHALALHAARARPVRFVEVRVISNTTGDRPRQRWNLPVALAGLQRLAAALAVIARDQPVARSRSG